MNKLALLVLSALLLVLAPVQAGQARVERFDPNRDAAADVAAAITVASAQRKRVLVEVGGNWCTWCLILDKFIAGHEDVRQLVDEEYVWVKVNWSSENRNERLLSRWPKVSGYPHLFVLDAAGQLVHSQKTSDLEAGRNYDSEKVLSFLRQYRQP